MDVEVVPIESIHADPANVRKHGERNLDAIRASLARFGQQKPVVVDGKGIVRAGNGTLEAARALGWETIAVVRTPLVGTEATAYGIADNRTSELAVWDETGLAETLRALQSEDFDLDAVGYTDAEVDAMIAGLGDAVLGDAVNDPAGEWQGMPECENEAEPSHRILIVHFATPEAVADFAERIGQSFTDSAKYIWHPKQKMQHPSAKPYVNEP